MDTNVPYMPSVTNLSKILDAIQKAGVPSVFNLDFLKDLGFTSSNDRPVIKVLKYLGMLDTSGHPQSTYREFVDHTKAKVVLAGRIRATFDDLYLSDKDAHNKSAEQLKGWFKTKTGASDSVAKKNGDAVQVTFQLCGLPGSSGRKTKDARGEIGIEGSEGAARIAVSCRLRLEGSRLSLQAGDPPS